MNLTIRPLTKEDVKITLEPEPEEVSHKGLEWEVQNAFPGDEKGPVEDREADVRMREDICRRVRRGDDWAFGTAVVTVSWGGFYEETSLGHCSYADAEDFMKNGYFADMVEEAVDGLNKKLSDLLAKLAPLLSDGVDPAPAAVPGVGGTT